MTTLEQAASAALAALDDMIERVVFLAGERDPVAPSVVARAAADALRQVLAAQPTRPLSPFDAVATAMRMASLLAGAVGMNDTEKADAYAARLRSHLVEYIYPQQATQALQAFGIIDPDYARIFTQARIVAWQYGYACLAHGTFTRDLDLLLVPWTERTGTGAPVDPKGVVHRIADVCGLKVQGEPSDKPHGRKAWSLLLPGFSEVRWVDVSAVAAPRPVAFDLIAHLQRQIDFSERTFGPGPRVAGVCDHIRKELHEVQDDAAAGLPTLSEWIDVIILAFDGAWRSGATPQQIVDAIVAKQTRNEGRRWPDWRTADPEKAIEHDRTEDVPATPSAAEG